MNEHSLLEAINTCNQGGVQFNLGNNRAFLFGPKWYPLRAVINHALALDNLTEVTTDRALVELVYLGFYVRIEDIQFNDHFPVPLNGVEVVREANKISFHLARLTAQ
jgi:hypothetical protein